MGRRAGTRLAGRGGRVPGHVVGGAGGVARGGAGLHAVGALQAQRVVGVLALLPALPARQVVQDGVHERREARGPGREGGRPMQGVPLALSLGRGSLLQLSQPPPLLLDHLLPCRRTGGHRGRPRGRWRHRGRREGASRRGPQGAHFGPEAPGTGAAAAHARAHLAPAARLAPASAS